MPDHVDVPDVVVCDVVVCDVGSLHRPDLVTVEALARLHVAVRRCGASLVLRGASSELLSLLTLCGLDDALDVRPSSVEVTRHAERREEPRVEKVRDRDDPAL